ncbi:MAG: hypothetical protein WB797_11640 [Nocardioides sp.]
MQDATSLGASLPPLLPLRIGTVEHAAPTLTVIGERWSLVLLGDWSWCRDDLVVTGSARPGAEDAVLDLCGSKVIGIDFPDPDFDGDCSFRLSDGSLEVRSDRSGWETWTFHHDDLDVVFVGL